MTTSDLPTVSETSQIQPSATLTFRAPVPLIPGEEVSNYDALLARVSGAVKPADFLEEVWVREVVDLVWDAIRLRRLKAALLTASADRGMQEVLWSLDVEDATACARAWAARNPEAIAHVEPILATAGLALDAVMAQTLRVRIADIERIDRLTASAEARRNIALREIEAHRAGFAKTLQRAAQDVEDAEYTDVTPAPAEQAA